jgi:hypothetical protein
MVLHLPPAVRTTPAAAARPVTLQVPLVLRQVVWHQQQQQPAQQGSRLRLVISRHREALVKPQDSSSSSSSSLANPTAEWVREAVSLLQLHHMLVLQFHQCLAHHQVLFKALAHL